MSIHRTILVAAATLFTTVTASGAFACCGGWGPVSPVVYASYAPTYATPIAAAPIVVGGGCGGCCGGCSVPTAAAVFAAPVAPAPLLYGGWAGGCGGCGSWIYGAAAVTPAFVVNQGPSYGGPGIMVPYRTWSPYSSYGGGYPYIRHRYWGPRYYGGWHRQFAYGPRPYFRPHFGSRYYGHWHS